MRSLEARPNDIVADDERSHALHAAVAAKILVDPRALEHTARAQATRVACARRQLEHLAPSAKSQTTTSSS
jgi:hypothetical protein